MYSSCLEFDTIISVGDRSLIHFLNLNLYYLLLQDVPLSQFNQEHVFRWWTRDPTHLKFRTSDLLIMTKGIPINITKAFLLTV